MASVFEQFNPAGELDVVWDPQNMRQSGEMPPELAVVTNKFNSVSTVELLLFIDQGISQGVDERTGMAHTTYASEGDSTDTLIVHGNPYMNGATDNMKLRGQYLYEGLKALGIRDEQGNPIPVMSLARPGVGSRLRLSPEAAQNRRILRNEIRHGNFQPVGRADLEVVRRVHPNVGKIARIGFSFDASVAPTEAVLAPVYGFDMTHLGIADPVNVVPRKDRSSVDLVTKDFGPEGKLLGPATERAEIRPFRDLHKDGLIPLYLDAAKSIAPVFGTDWWLGQGMATNTFAQSLVPALRMGVATTVGFTNNGTVSPAERTKTAVDHARHNSGRDVYTVQMGDEHPETHCIGDQLDVMTTFYAYGLSR